MRAFFFLLFGAAAGVVATVMLFTLDPDFDGAQSNGVGDGNARLSLDEDALASIMAEEMPEVPGFKNKSTVTVRVQPDGLLKVQAVFGDGIGLRASFTLDPEVVEGKLKMEVRDADFGELPVPVGLAESMEAPLRARLEALAAGFEYRLTSIQTTGQRLTLEIEI
ncbi:MAG: LmeA family phospholipid-binding protein [Tepidiformaceae bacterium]